MSVHWIGTFGSLCLCSLLAVGLRAQDRPKAAPTEKISNPETTKDMPEWTNALKRQLEKQCIEGLAKGPSCFEVPIGGRVNDFVPVGEISESEKSGLLAGWGKALQPEYLPQDRSKITWRKLLLTQVAWQPAKPGSRSWGPPREDWFCATWMVDGRPVVVVNQNISVTLTGPDRISYRPPTREEVGTMATSYILQTQMDKPALLNLLLSVFRVPWQSEEDFVVRWPLASPGPHSLRVLSARFHKESESNPEAWREWFDEMIFEIEGADPQFITFGIWKFPS
jgi:hypothetical protein